MSAARRSARAAEPCAVEVVVVVDAAPTAADQCIGNRRGQRSVLLADVGENRGPVAQGALLFRRARALRRGQAARRDLGHGLIVAANSSGLNVSKTSTD